MRLTYPNPAAVPQAVKNAALKYAYTYIVQELLRLRHKQEGAPYKSLIEPYEQQLASGEIDREKFDELVGPILAPFRQWEENWFMPRSKTVVADLLELRAVVKAYVIQYQGAIDLEGIPID